MELFSLEKYIENPSRKVMTRDGRPVHIICTDRKGKSGNIVGFVGEDESFIYVWNNDGKHVVSEDSDNDLFFADEELTEFEKELNRIVTAFSATHAYMDETEIHHYSKELLDLSRKEIEKENSEFKPKFTYNEKDYSELANKLIEFRNNTPLCPVSYRDGEGRKIILHYEKEILDLVKKELLKDLPKWKKVPLRTTRKELFNMMHKGIVTVFNGYKDYYYLDKTDLGKLPKEE